MLAVSDNGTGMDDEVKRHILNPFHHKEEQGLRLGWPPYLASSSRQGYVRVHSKVAMHGL